MCDGAGTAQRAEAYLVARAAHDGREDRAGRVVAREASLHQPGTVVAHQGGGLLVVAHLGTASAGSAGGAEQGGPSSAPAEPAWSAPPRRGQGRGGSVSSVLTASSWVMASQERDQRPWTCKLDPQTQKAEGRPLKPLPLKSSSRWHPMASLSQSGPHAPISLSLQACSSASDSVLIGLEDRLGSTGGTQGSGRGRGGGTGAAIF